MKKNYTITEAASIVASNLCSRNFKLDILSIKISTKECGFEFPHKAYASAYIKVVKRIYNELKKES